LEASHDGIAGRLQCCVRAWNYSDYTQPRWPTTATAQGLFDPLWGVDDPAAGDWFGQEALQLAQLANPALPLP
jgi:endoglucanase